MTRHKRRRHFFHPYSFILLMDSRPLKVFPSTSSGHCLCHARPDADAVRALYARLKADGVDAWLNKENIIPGQDFDTVS
jgi:hypothetical protein